VRLVSLLFVGVFAACGIDESGLLSDASSPTDATTMTDALSDARADVVMYDNYVPPPCTTPDASLDASCLGPALPAGWEPFAMELDASAITCPGGDGGDFMEVDYTTNPQVIGNSCVCMGCSTSTSSWDCSGTLSAGGIVPCTSQTQPVGDTPYCWSTTHASFSGTVSRTGSAVCGANNYYSTTAVATNVAGCAPTRCQSDFCGLAGQGFKLCARNSSVTDGGCPASLPVSYVVGQNPHATCNACPTCSIANADAACSATLTPYSGNGGPCEAGAGTTVNADGTCNTTGMTFFNSVLYDPGAVPVPDCEPSGPTNVGGTGTLDAPLTVCCLN
jgi:hypothetical protein